MNQITAFEKIRLEKQTELDSQRNKKLRNELGQFATPTILAREITRHALSYLDIVHDQINFLEPSIGSGSFFSALISELKLPIRRALGIELDNRFADLSTSLWGGSGLKIINDDFTEVDPGTENKNGFNLLLANPPYVRHHHINQDKKRALQGIVKKHLGLTSSGLAGLYIYFILLSDKWLQDGAISAWLIPTEWMDVNYGKVLKEYLLNHVQILQVHKYDFDDEKFHDATVSSSVIFFKKTQLNSKSSCIFSSGKSIEEPSAFFKVQKEEMDPSGKWSSFFGVRNKELKNDDKNRIRLGDVFDIRRGIATGGNKFFVKRVSEFQTLGIPDEFLKPVIPPIKKLKNIQRIQGDAFGYPDEEEKLALFSSALSEELIKLRYPKVWMFLNSPDAQEVKNGYLTSNRNPWYSQEARLKPDVFVTYMGRSRNGKQPFHFIINHSNAIATNTYLLMVLKTQFQTLCDDKIIEKVVCFLNSNESELTKYGRVYGGGLWKLEPKELAMIDLSKILVGIVETPKQSSLILA